MAQNPPSETKPAKNKRPVVCRECGRVWEKDGNGKSEILTTCPECEIKRKLFAKIKIL
jgi:predicted  nucleic acid-binding Zn-ribbon protein